MKPAKMFLAIFLANVTLQASSSDDITIVNQASPDFLLGKETHMNMKLNAQDDKDMWLKIGVRVQGTFENESITDAAGVTTYNSDAYLRRTRLEVQAGYTKNTSFTMDIRDDKANKEDGGEKTFNIGDAYVKIANPFDTSALNFKLYRAKIDISRTETVKSAHVIVYDRPKVADEAAQFITHNRRGTNAQAYGDLFDKKIQYQVAFGDATYSGEAEDASGTALSKASGIIARQSFFYGGKVTLSPFSGWEETKKTETYFGQGKHFSFGASYWTVPNIISSISATEIGMSRALVNAEVSAHYQGAFIQAEYFAFDGVAQDWSTLTATNTGRSTGWYVTGEYVFVDLGYVAPFFRYESWDRFVGSAGYAIESSLFGINWYLRGNTTKCGFVVQMDSFGTNVGNEKVQSLRFTSQWFF